MKNPEKLQLIGICITLLSLLLVLINILFFIGCIFGIILQSISLYLITKKNNKWK